MIHYSGHKPHHFSGAHFGGMHHGAQQVSPPTSQPTLAMGECARHLYDAYNAAFGHHHDNSEIANFVASLCNMRTPGQCRRLLRVSLRYGLLSAEIPHSIRPQFMRVTMRALRDGECFHHQRSRKIRRLSRVKPSFGAMHESAPSAGGDGAPANQQQAQGNQFDQQAFTTVLTSILNVVPSVINAATEAENRKALEEAAQATGADPSSEWIDRYAALMTQQQQQVSAAPQGSAAQDAALAQQAALIQQMQAELASQDEGLSTGAIAGFSIAGVALVGLIAVLAARGGRNVHYGGMHDSYGSHCYGGHCF